MKPWLSLTLAPPDTVIAPCAPRLRPICNWLVIETDEPAPVTRMFPTPPPLKAAIMLPVSETTPPEDTVSDPLPVAPTSVVPVVHLEPTPVTATAPDDPLWAPISLVADVSVPA